MNRRPQPGQVRKLDVATRNDVVGKITDNPFLNAAIVGREYGVHRNTIRKVWNDNGLYHRIAAKKPRLTPEQEEQRLGYALANLTTDWSKVIFSDEKTFQTDRHQKTHLYRPNNCRFDRKYIQPTQRSGRISAGIWGWISIDGPGEMCMISGRNNSDQYIEILEQVLIPTVEYSYGGFDDMIFMQVFFTVTTFIQSIQ